MHLRAPEAESLPPLAQPSGAGVPLEAQRSRGAAGLWTKLRRRRRRLGRHAARHGIAQARMAPGRIGRSATHTPRRASERQTDRRGRAGGRTPAGFRTDPSSELTNVRTSGSSDARRTPGGDSVGTAKQMRVGAARAGACACVLRLAWPGGQRSRSPH